MRAARPSRSRAAFTRAPASGALTVVESQRDAAESAIVNPADLAHLEALGALHLIYAGAASGLGSSDDAAVHAEHYRLACARERERTVIRLDLDGDGEPDASR